MDGRARDRRSADDDADEAWRLMSMMPKEMRPPPAKRRESSDDEVLLAARATPHQVC